METPARVTLLALTLAGGACAGPRTVSTAGHAAYEASLTRTHDGFAVAWYDDRHGNAEIYFRLLDASGRPAGPERRITSDPEQSYEADIQAIGDRFAIAWYDKAPDASLRAHVGVWMRDGTRVWSTTLTGGGHNARNPIVRASASTLFTAWIEESAAGEVQVWTAWWSADGRQTSAPRALAPAGATTWNLNGAIDENETAWVVFDATVGTRADELFAARTGDSPAVTRLTADDGRPSKYPDVVFGGGRVGLTWFDERDGNREIYFWTGTGGELQPGIESRAVRVTRTEGESIGAYVSWNGGRFGLAWNDNSDGQHEIYFEPFDPAGRALGAAARITNTRTASLIPAIRPSSHGFALAWNETVLPVAGHDAATWSRVAFTEVR